MIRVFCTLLCVVCLPPFWLCSWEPGAYQQSNTDQQMSFRNRWSSSTSSRIASGSWLRCHRHSSRPARSRVKRPSRLEEVKNVLRAQCRPKSEELMIRIGEGSTTADRHETRVAVFREDHTQHPFCSHLPNMEIAGSSLSIE